MAGETREELHTKILAFLSGEFARTEGHQCVHVGLYYRAPGIGDEDLYSRDRTVADEAEWFSTQGLVEKMVREILDRAEQQANSFTTNAKARRFFIRTKQHLGGRQTFPFAMQATSIVSYDDDDDDGPVRGGKDGDGNALVGDAFKTLVKVNAGMFGDSLKALSAQLTAAVKENAELNAENRTLRRQIDEVTSTRMDREWSIQKEMKRENRADQGFAKFIQLGTIVASKMLPGSGLEQTMDGGGDALEMMIAKFFEGLSEDQGKALLAILKMEQQMLLYEIDQLIKKRSQARAEAEAKRAATNAATGKPQQGNNGTPSPTP